MAQHSILDEIEERKQRILESRNTLSADTADEEQQLARRTYAENEHAFLVQVRSVYEAVRERKAGPDDTLSTQTLNEESAYYQAMGELFFAMANSRKHPLHAYVQRNDQRKKDVLLVHRTAIAIARHYDTLAKDPRRYQRVVIMDKLNTLLVWLDNMLPPDL